MSEEKDLEFNTNEFMKKKNMEEVKNEQIKMTVITIVFSILQYLAMLSVISLAFPIKCQMLQLPLVCHNLE